MNVPFQGPPGIDHPILVPHPREAVFDSYDERVPLDGPVWHLNDPGHNFRLDWTALEFTHRGMVEATADYLVDLITSSSASHVQNAFRALKRLKTLGAFRRWSHPTIRLGNRPDLLQTFFYEAREAAKLSVGELHHLQHWFGFLSKREGSGVNPTSASIVNAITVGGNPKGVAVLTRDPTGGPLDDAETTALLQALRAAQETNSVPIDRLALVWLCVILGPNPRMISLMRDEDFEDENGHAQIAVPRIKGKDRLVRTKFKIRKLDAHSAGIMKRLVATNRAARQAVPWEDEAFGHALFHRTTPDPAKVGRPRHAYAMHRTPKDIGWLITRTVLALKVVSPRTGKVLRAGPRRFRYTFATRLLREGASKRVVAELLDHRDEQTVRAYVNLRGDVVEKLDAATARELAPMAQAFLGTLVGSEAEALRGGTRASRIFGSSTAPESGVGTCGSFAFCGLAAPTACYTCVRFQPWLDGPHERILDTLLKGREERRARRLDGRMITMLDNTILAVADVVMRCEEVKRARSERKDDAA